MLGAMLIAAALAAPPVDIGGQRQIFVDRHVIESMDGVTLELGRPRDEGVVFRFDRSWEGAFSGYSTVIRDGDRLLLYYRGLPVAGADGTSRETTCVALSTDGIEWTRPDLGLFEIDGTRENNVVLADAAPVTHNFSPFLDTRPDVHPDHRFKALGGNERSGLIAYTSGDGLQWTRLRPEPVVTGGMFDSQNVAFWSAAERRYVCYLRTWTGGGYSGFRSVSRSTSEDFVAWTPPEPMSFGAGPPEHIYTNQTHPYFRAPQVYIALAARFMPGRQVISAEAAARLGVDPRYFRDCSDAVLMSSRGGTRYDRTFREAFLRPGIGLENWVSRSNYPALNVVQTGPTEMSLYVNQNYAQPTANLRRYALRLDGLASLSAGAAGGTWVSRPLTFRGGRLEINFATSAAGGIRVEIRDEQGVPVPGFALEDSIEQIGNEIERVVSWRSGPDVSSLAGRPVRLRVRMQDADLYSFRFVPPPIRLRSVERIWDAAPHNAFTDLLRVGNRLYCTFREGERHVFGRDGRIRVIVREDGGPWRSVALLEEPGVDLRDPKLSLSPDGRVVVSCGGSTYEGRTLVRRGSRVVFSDLSGDAFGPVRPVVIDESIRSDDDWLWRVTWVRDTAYGVVYQPRGEASDLHLAASRDGVYYDHVTTFELDGAPNETTLRLNARGEMVALVRRERGDRRAYLGTAAPPFEDWSFSPLPEPLGGPNLIALDDRAWLVAGRRYGADGPRTILARLGADGAWKTIATLPSAGDTSYPGLVRDGGTLLMSYYSSHEDKTAVYLATFDVGAWQAAGSGHP
jgi:hypothetical protein